MNLRIRIQIALIALAILPSSGWGAPSHSTSSMPLASDGARTHGPSRLSQMAPSAAALLVGTGIGLVAGGVRDGGRRSSAVEAS